jgi:hypothetical protein
MTLVICAGFHDNNLNNRFLDSLRHESVIIEPYIIITPFYCLNEVFSLGEDLTLIGFSAGVVNAIALAHYWQAQGVIIKALLALDGWGVPLIGNFPIYRLSHDYFTHWSSCLLGSGQENFYADPPVDHLSLWSSPGRVTGWSVRENFRQRTTALTFLSNRLGKNQLSIIS